ncbi:MAG: hypothetical protein HOC60_01855 [Rhodospirillaceae bacterium]|nr:hypothetical protein [Rhodospirillaceae bacterium]MBT4463401.1 hypothetical protein [Rhodospirillaceae bacterium]MBT5013340.1 hypothetical protein [Rhodospirillaceae bacterium]MBT7357232.1 hypothetical protein [Rhodospirillaceae bacterium]
MSAKEHFNWSWVELKGQPCLHVAPKEWADGARWAAFTDEFASSFSDGRVFYIVDIRAGEEKTDLDGFKEIIAIYKKHGIESAVIAVITTDQFHDMTATMFKHLADSRDFDLQIKVFLSDATATSWMEECIGSGSS